MRCTWRVLVTFERELCHTSRHSSDLHIQSSGPARGNTREPCRAERVARGRVGRADCGQPIHRQHCCCRSLVAATYPVPLHYLYEARQGKSYALNSGLRATRSRFVLFTDDDVRVEPGWIDAAIAPMLADDAVDYTGGPVYPIWEAPAPSWLRRDRGDLWGAIAILDYGPLSFVFEDQGRIPIGANMAVRRTMLDAVGGFDPELGRRGTSLLGQEQAEFFCRARSAGARGTYVPDMSVQHHVPAQRLTRRYFRRWWLWKGISRARLHRAHPLSEGSVTPQEIKRVAGVPVFAVAEMVRHAIRWLGSLLRGDMPVCRGARDDVGILHGICVGRPAPARAISPASEGPPSSGRVEHLAADAAACPS